MCSFFSCYIYPKTSNKEQYADIYKYIDTKIHSIFTFRLMSHD